MNGKRMWDYSQGELQAVLHAMELYQKAAGIVSPELMILQQTEEAAQLLEGGAFYSLEDHLSPDTCREIRRCIESGEEGRMRETLDGTEKAIRILPSEGCALLLIENARERIPALLLDAARMRQSAAVLLETAEQMDAMPDSGMAAARIRREAMRLLRQAVHCEVLGGDSVSMARVDCDISGMVYQLGRLLEEKGIVIQTETQPDLWIAGDLTLIQSAVMTLVANSLRFGGESVRIRVRAQRYDDGVLLRVEDDGPGMPVQAAARQISGWKQKDADLLDGDWGMGLPFANRVAEMHGGRLYHVYEKTGCAVCLLLHDAPPDGLASSMVYETGGPSAVDIELSTVLGAEAYHTAR